MRIYKSEQHSDFDGWVGLRKLDVQILVCEIIHTPRIPIVIVRCTDFLGHECSDLGVSGWVSRNRNIVRICKSVRIIGHFFSSLDDHRKLIETCTHYITSSKQMCS